MNKLNFICNRSDGSESLNSGDSGCIIVVPPPASSNLASTSQTNHDRIDEFLQMTRVPSNHNALDQAHNFFDNETIDNEIFEIPGT